MAKTSQEGLTSISPEVMAAYEPVIGLEVHVQLKTLTKAFCGCSTRFGDAPNSNTCPVCLGLPGALPVLNKRAVELGIRAALALHLNVQDFSRFARKNYFYPDLPKGYQISMYELPLATGGYLEIEHDGQIKRIGITRLHLEDDAAKNLHEGFPDSAEKSYVDYNRGGTPLAEIVSEPDLRTPTEAHAYLTALKEVMLYTEVSDCNMEEGSLRCDANVSVRKRGAEKFGTKAEVKNLNSFRHLQHALEYEIERQIGVLESGGKIMQETRLWNVAAGRTESMRSKEFAHDYRYFPEPDLLPLRVNAAWREAIAGAMVELPEAKRQRFVREYGITPYDAGVLASTRELADYFEEAARAGAPAKSAANWIQVELLRQLKEAGKEITESPVRPAELAALIAKVESGEITGSTGKKIFAKMFESRKSLAEVLSSEVMGQISSTNEIEHLLVRVLRNNLDKLDQLHVGKESIRKFFIGEVMKSSRGRVNPSKLAEEISTAILRHTNLARLELKSSQGLKIVEVKFYGELIGEKVSGTFSGSLTIKQNPELQDGGSTQDSNKVLETSTNPTSGGE